jgi:hypothetical protein
MKTRGSLLYSQKHATEPYPEPDKSNQGALAVFFKIQTVDQIWLRAKIVVIH